MSKDWDDEDWEESFEIQPAEWVNHVQDQKDRLLYGELNEDDVPPPDPLDLSEGDRFLDEYNRVWAVENGEWELQGFGDPENKVPTSFFSGINAEIFLVEITNSNDPIAAGDTLEIEATVKNNGVTGSQEIELLQDDDVKDTKQLDLNLDQSKTITLEWETDATLEEDSYEVVVQSEDDSDSTTVDISETFVFEVEITDTNEPIEDGGTVEVDATITNTGSESDTQDVELVYDGDVKDTDELTLSSDEDTSVTLSWDNVEYGTYNLIVQSAHYQDSVNVTVDDPPTFVIDITDSNSPIPEGDSLDVDINVENTSDSLDDTQTIELEVDGSVQDTNDVTLNSGTSTDITLSWDDTAPGNYTATVSSELEEDTLDVKVNTAGSYFDVTIKDAPEEITNQETFEAEVGIENVGDADDIQDITLSLDQDVGEVDSVTDLDLAEDEATTEVLSWDSPEEGQYTVTVASSDDSATQDLEVIPDDIALAVNEESVDESYQIEIEDLFEIEFEVINKGAVSGTGTVFLKDGDKDLDSANLTLDAGEVVTTTLEWQTTNSDSGSYTLTLDSGGQNSDRNPTKWRNKVDFELIISTFSSGKAGIIIHTSPGETLEGLEEDAENWVEIYGGAVRTSKYE